MRRPSRFVTTASLALLSLASGCQEIPVEPALQSSSSPTAPQGALATVTRIDLGTLGGAVSFAMDINDAGIVVGWSDDSSGANRAFRWTSARGMVDLGTLVGDQWSRATSITSNGRIVGVSGRTGDPVGTPVTWSPSGSIAPLMIPVLPGTPVMLPTDGNALGQVIGATNLGMFPSHAWIWNRVRGLHDIGADMPAEVFESSANEINERGIVVGNNKANVCTNPRIGECWHAFLWHSPSRFRDLGVPAGSDLGSAAVTGSALNDEGVVVGWTIPGPGTGLQPYRWNARTGFTLLPTFAYEFTPYGYARSVNLISTDVGASQDAQVGAIQAAAWPRAGGIVKLNADDPNSSVAKPSTFSASSLVGRLSTAVASLPTPLSGSWGRAVV